jgi:hypothetical protein
MFVFRFDLDAQNKQNLHFCEEKLVLVGDFGWVCRQRQTIFVLNLGPSVKYL